jgi:Bacterial TSP3 repeat
MKSNLTCIMGLSILLAALVLACSISVFGQVTPRVPPGSQEVQLEQVEKAIQTKQLELRRLARERTQLESSASGSRTRGLFALPAGMSPQGTLRSDAVTVPAPGTDSDGDGLTDSDELILGTDPINPDSDGDALLDGWEVKGVNGINLNGFGASPLHKDIFVQMDFMTRSSAANGLGPNENVLQGIRNVFAAAPVANPDGLTGINIHLVPGREVQYKDDLNPYFVDFPTIKTSSFDPRRAPVFHYMIWANAYDGTSSSGISMDIPHSDFIVTVGRWHQNNGGTDLEKIGTFVHELGHNLGLHHGGNEDTNFKPNHLSVMSYSFQMVGVRRFGVRLFDYQRFPIPRLQESVLRESEGLGRDPSLQGYFAVFYTQDGNRHEVPCDGNVDWSNNGTIDAQDISADLNGDSQLLELKDTPNEWGQLYFRGGLIGSRIGVGGLFESPRNQIRRLPFVELTEELSEKLKTSD